MLCEEDAVAEEGEACSAVNLPRDQLGLRVDALGGSVAERECKSSDDGVAVEAAGEGVHMGQVDCPDLGDPGRKGIGVSLGGYQELGEGPDVDGQLGHLGARGGELGQEAVLFGREVVGPAEQHPGESARGDVAAVGVRTALVDVLVQEVETACEPEGLDLFEEVQDGDAGILDPAFAQMLAVGVDEAGTVFRDAEHPLGPIGPGVAFDGVQGQLETAGAFEQAHALVEQVMELVPALQSGLCAGPVVERRAQDGGPATAVGLDLAQRGFARVVGSGPGAVPGSLPDRFLDPPAEPGVRLSPHRALHEIMPSESARSERPARLWGCCYLGSGSG